MDRLQATHYPGQIARDCQVASTPNTAGNLCTSCPDDEHEKRPTAILVADNYEIVARDRPGSDLGPRALRSRRHAVQ
jgi:hypothetical protein